MTLVSDVFLKPREENEIDLISEITSILQSLNHINPSGWLAGNEIQEALGKNSKFQRFLINRYWRIRLGMCQESTTRERYCLIDTGEDTEYLQIFRDAVAPTIVRLGLV